MNEPFTIPPRVLIVDDNPKNLQVLGKILQGEQYEVEFAIDGIAALEWLEIKPFDLILLDVNMPGLDGFEVCRRIRANRKHDRLPVIFLTAETLRESVLKGFELGGQDYITKPFDSRELTMRVKTQVLLKRHIEQLEDLNQNLELKVQERTRELTIAKEKAEESDRLKTAFLMNISHEIRTPMNGILGFLRLLEKPDLDDSRRKEFLSMANISGQRLVGTINDIIEISKIEIGDAAIVISEVNTEELMQAQLASHTSLAREKALVLSVFDHVRGDDARILSDRSKLEKILSNLILNAIKFTVRGSVEIGNFLAGNELVFIVKDTGIGIPADQFGAVFERFVQADMSLNRNYEGSGIGLSIVKAYVEALGGKVWLQSEVGKGSTFYFSVPYKPVMK